MKKRNSSPMGLKRYSLYRYPENIVGCYRNAVTGLAELDSNLKDALINLKEYTFSVRVTDLNKLFPKDRVRPSRFYSLIQYLERLGIHMNVLPKKVDKNAEIINLIEFDKDRKDDINE